MRSNNQISNSDSLTEWVFQQGNALHAAEKLEEAYGKYIEVININPNHAPAYYHLGTILVKHFNEFESGIKVLEAARSLACTNHSHAFYLPLIDALIRDALNMGIKIIKPKPKFINYIPSQTALQNNSSNSSTNPPPAQLASQPHIYPPSSASQQTKQIAPGNLIYSLMNEINKRKLVQEITSIEKAKYLIAQQQYAPALQELGVAKTLASQNFQYYLNLCKDIEAYTAECKSTLQKANSQVNNYNSQPIAQLPITSHMSVQVASSNYHTTNNHLLPSSNINKTQTDTVSPDSLAPSFNCSSSSSSSSAIQAVPVSLAQLEQKHINETHITPMTSSSLTTSMSYNSNTSDYSISHQTSNISLNLDNNSWGIKRQNLGQPTPTNSRDYSSSNCNIKV